MVVILGAGISGISAGYHLAKNEIPHKIFEKDSDWGGLTGNFEVNGFRFDKAIHLSFTKNDYVKAIFSSTTAFNAHTANPSNYYKGCWAKHPVQNNLHPLPVDIKVKVISDFIENKHQEESIHNYEDWLRFQYGDYFAEQFTMKYTRKYWCCEAEELSTSWVGSRMYKPDINEVLYGAMTEKTTNTYYAKEMRYPKKGGYKSFLNLMRESCHIETKHEVLEIDAKNKVIEFSNGLLQCYQHVISTIPLPEYANLIKVMPSEVREACEKLKSTSVALISVGLKNHHKKYPRKDSLWFYIYDEDILPSRCYSPSEKSPDNAPENCYSYQFEIYFNQDKPLNGSSQELINSVLNSAEKMEMFELDDVLVTDLTVLDYGNVIFYKGMEQDRQIVLDYLESQGIITAGRFGEWDYLWSDQSLLSGQKAALEIAQSFSSE